MKTTIFLYEATLRKINAPSFIYGILHNTPPKNIQGRIFHPQKKFRDIYVDEKIPIRSLELLNNIVGITVRSSCQGENEERPTYLIFRTLNQEKNYIKNIVINLNKNENIKAGFDIGNGNLYRIGVTTFLWYEKDPKEFNNWWNSLPKKIKESL